MHGSVLQNADYIRFSADHAVEVIAMEEMRRALDEKSANVATYAAKDEYGEAVRYLEQFPGLTVEQLQALNESEALHYMEGGRIPYTAIVDPHSSEEIEALKGVKSAKELIEAIGRGEKRLEGARGPGMTRAAWDAMRRRRVAIDRRLAAKELGKAMEEYRLLAKEIENAPDVAKRKVGASLAVILDDATKELEAAEAELAGGRRAQAQAAAKALVAALRGTDLEARARKLADGAAER